MKIRVALAAVLVATVSFMAGLEYGRAEEVTKGSPEASTTAKDASAKDAASSVGNSDVPLVSTDQIEKAAAGLGYTYKATKGDYGTVDVVLSKEGKTDEKFGALGKRWEQRETLD